MRSQGHDRRRERGAVMVFVALAATTLLMLGAYAIEVGLVWGGRTQGQAVADSSALAAAGAMIVDPLGSNPSADLGGARAEATKYAGLNPAVANSGISLNTASDIEFGNWNLQNREFHDGPPFYDPLDVDTLTAARVTVHQDDVENNNVPGFLSGLVGRDGYDVVNVATAYLGFQGGFSSAEFDLPVAVWSCELGVGSDCGGDFCATVASPPNPCSLCGTPGADDQGNCKGENWHQAHDVPDGVTCLEFSDQGDQNACFTDFGEDSSVNTNELRDIVENGNPNSVDVGDPVRVDNGEKTPVMQDIRDKWMDPDYGEDRYPPFFTPPRNDSWVVKLPVVDCDGIGGCSNTLPTIVGGVCFEIREVRQPAGGGGGGSPGGNSIRGRFLCPNDPDPEVRQLFQEKCRGDGGTGTAPPAAATSASAPTGSSWSSSPHSFPTKVPCRIPPASSTRPVPASSAATPSGWRRTACSAWPPWCRARRSSSRR